MCKQPKPLSDITVIRCGSSEPRVDSRDIAKRLGLKHHSTYKVLKERKADFKQFGLLRFEIQVIDGKGQPGKYAMLNEDQAYLLLTYSRNTAKVRELKIKLVKAFGHGTRQLSDGGGWLAHRWGLSVHLPDLAVLRRFAHNVLGGMNHV